MPRKNQSFLQLKFNHSLMRQRWRLCLTCLKNWFWLHILNLEGRVTLRKLVKSGVKSPGLRELFLRISWCLRSSAFVLLHSSPNLSYSGSPLFTGLGELQILNYKAGFLRSSTQELLYAYCYISYKKMRKELLHEFNPRLSLNEERCSNKC